MRLHDELRVCSSGDRRLRGNAASCPARRQSGVDRYPRHPSGVAAGGMGLRTVDPGQQLRLCGHQHRRRGSRGPGVVGGAGSGGQLPVGCHPDRAIIGALQGAVLGRWQWEIISNRLGSPAATLGHARSSCADRVAVGHRAGGDTLTREATPECFKNGFIQALVLGPDRTLAGHGTAERHKQVGVVVRGKVTSYLTGAVMYRVGGWLLDELSLTGEMTPAFPTWRSSSTGHGCCGSRRRMRPILDGGTTASGGLDHA